MRVWDVEAKYLCRNHLLGEHREIHAIWSIIYNNKSGYRHHPEVLRWVGKLDALFERHGHVVKEMMSRGYNHNSDLELVGDSMLQDMFVHSIPQQIDILNNKPCDCKNRMTPGRIAKIGI